MKRKVQMQDAIADIKEMFGVVEFDEFKKSSASKSFYSINEDGSATFQIDKRNFERDEVISRLYDYFSDKMVEGGYCEINAITLVWTTVELKWLSEGGEL